MGSNKAGFICSQSEPTVTHRTNRILKSPHVSVSPVLELQPVLFKKCVAVHGFVCAVLTQIIGAGSSLRDVNKRSSRWDVQDLVVTEGNRAILETSRHLSAGGVPPIAHSTFVDHRAGAKHAIATLGLAGEEGENM